MALLTFVGIVNGFGIFQTYLLQYQLSNYTESDVAWIGSVQIFLSFGGGLISGRSALKIIVKLTLGYAIHTGQSGYF